MIRVPLSPDEFAKAVLDEVPGQNGFLLLTVYDGKQGDTYRDNSLHKQLEKVFQHRGWNLVLLIFELAPEPQIEAILFYRSTQDPKLFDEAAFQRLVKEVLQGETPFVCYPLTPQPDRTRWFNISSSETSDLLKPYRQKAGHAYQFRKEYSLADTQNAGVTNEFGKHTSRMKIDAPSKVKASHLPSERERIQSAVSQQLKRTWLEKKLKMIWCYGVIGMDNNKPETAPGNKDPPIQFGSLESWERKDLAFQYPPVPGRSHTPRDSLVPKVPTPEEEEEEEKRRRKKKKDDVAVVKRDILQSEKKFLGTRHRTIHGQYSTFDEAEWCEHWEDIKRKRKDFMKKRCKEGEPTLEDELAWQAQRKEDRRLKRIEVDGEKNRGKEKAKGKAVGLL